MEVLSRGGKTTSKYSDYFNVRGEGGKEDGVYLDRVEWRKDEGQTEAENEEVLNEKEKEDPEPAPTASIQPGGAASISAATVSG